MIISRTWAMPNKQTFKIKPINDLLTKYVTYNGAGWADPFCGQSTICANRNDINPILNGHESMEAMQYMKLFNAKTLQGVIIDPPYSLNQLKTLYNEFERGRGLYCVRPDSMIYWSKFKNLTAQKIVKGGICISFGWNSMGLGINRGFEKVEILLVAHGGSRNDTIVTVERKIK